MMKYLAILVVILASAATSPIGSENSDWERIVNASTPNPPVGDLPYLVSISNGTGVACGGWIHNEGWVITAASCVSGKQPDQVKVTVAQTSVINQNPDEVTYNVFSIRVNPGYDNVTKKHNIALLEMSGSITVTAGKVEPISFEQPEQEPKELTIAGFGAAFPLGPTSTVLRKTTVTLDTFSSTCASDSTNFDPVYMFCAGTGDTTGPCTADEGTPAVQVQGTTNRVVGIVSHKLNCGNPTPTVYTMVASYYAWILDTAGRPATLAP